MHTSPFGKMTIDALFGINDVKGVGIRSSIWQILEAFVSQNAACASRVSFGPSGALILTSIPGDPNSGAFYLYDSKTKWFFSVTFDGQENFSALLFDMVVCAYELDKFIGLPLAVEKKATQVSNHRRNHRGYHGNNRSNQVPVQNTVAA